MKLAVRRLGSARLEWVEAPESASWLAVPGPLGEEAAISVAADPLFCTEAAEAVPARPLGDDEVRQLPVLLQRGLELVRSLDAAWARHVRGVRPSLAGGVVLELLVPAGDQVRQLAHQLSQQCDFPVAVVTLEPNLAMHGSLGRIAHAADSVERILGRLLGESHQRPGGYPRIGATVVTPRGTGTVQSVRTRDRTVLVRIGEETVRFTVDELADRA